MPFWRFVKWYTLGALPLPPVLSLLVAACVPILLVWEEDLLLLSVDILHLLPGLYTVLSVLNELVVFYESEGCVIAGGTGGTTNGLYWGMLKDLRIIWALGGFSHVCMYCKLCRV